MASDLESDIRAAVKNGFLHFSMMKCWGKEEWSCGYRTTDSTTVHYAYDADPVAALRQALRAGMRESKTLTKEAASKPKRRDMEDLV